MSIHQSSNRSPEIHFGTFGSPESRNPLGYGTGPKDSRNSRNRPCVLALDSGDLAVTCDRITAQGEVVEAIERGKHNAQWRATILADLAQRTGRTMLVVTL